MKRVLVIIEGAADVPQSALNGRTPLQVARCIHATRLVQEGQAGLLVLNRKTNSSEQALGLLCGVSEKECYALTRGPLEAASVAEAGEDCVYAYCGNFVTMSEGRIMDPRVIGLSYEETKALANAIQQSFDPVELRIAPLAPARVAAMVRHESGSWAAGESPWLNDDAEAALPSGKKGKWIRGVLEKSANALGMLTLNDVRLDLGENPATHLWLWGGGPVTGEHYSVGRMAMLTQSAMAKGLARLCRADVLTLKDPWSESSEPIFDRKAVEKSLYTADFLVIYVEAPKEMAGYGSAVDKVRFLERVDVRLLGPLLELLQDVPDVQLVLTSDGLSRGDKVYAPLALWGAKVKADGVQRWDEASCATGALGHVEPAQVNNVMGV